MNDSPPKSETPPPPPDALIFKLYPESNQFVVLRVEEKSLGWWESMGWRKLVSERDVTRADIDDVRRDDESRWQR